jgi:hypothetical protein
MHRTKAIVSASFVIAALTLCGCSLTPSLPTAPSKFTLSGVAQFDVTVGPVVGVKLAMFYTGSTFYPVNDAKYDGSTTAVLVSNVAALGRTAGSPQAFSLAVDLSAYHNDNDTATLVLWDDANANDKLDVGERTARLIPNTSTACPVFGATGYDVPIQYSYFASADSSALGISALGWNHIFNDIDYRPAKDESGARIEDDAPFQLLP